MYQKKALFSWHITYLTCQSSVQGLINPWQQLRHSLTYGWWRTIKNWVSIKLFLISLVCFCVEMGWVGAYMCLVLLSKCPEHSSSPGLLLVHSQQGCPQLPVGWCMVPAQSRQHGGIVLPLPLLGALHHHLEQHCKWHCQKSSVTAGPDKCEPHSPDTKRVIFRTTNETKMLLCIQALKRS